MNIDTSYDNNKYIYYEILISIECQDSIMSAILQEIISSQIIDSDDGVEYLSSDSIVVETLENLKFS